MYCIDRLPDFSLVEKSAFFAGIPREALKEIEKLHHEIAMSPTLSALTVECCNQLARKKGSAESGKNFFAPVELERFRVLTLLLSFPAAQENFRAAGYPEESFFEIWRDFQHWAKHYLDGIGDLRFPAKVFHWFQLHIAAEVLAFGRLQFQFPDFCRFDADLSPWLAPGDPIVQFHIYEGEPLDIERCRASFRALPPFLKKYRPEHHYRAVVAHSWIFDPGLSEILSPQSNIMRFQQLGKIIPTEEPADTLWRVFGEKDPDSVQNPNSLQKKVLDHIRSGKEFHYGFLVIPRDELETL